MKINHGDTGKVIYFVAVDATDLKTRETSLSNLAVWYDLAGGGKADMTTPTATHVANGVFKLAVDEAGMVTLESGEDNGELVLHITADEMAPITRVIEVSRELGLSKTIKSLLMVILGK